MMRPERRARIVGRNARVTAIRPKTLVSYCARMSASVMSSVGPRTPKPALLTSTSMPWPPVSASSLGAARAIEAPSVTSSWTVSTAAPSGAP